MLKRKSVLPIHRYKLTDEGFVLHKSFLQRVIFGIVLGFVLGLGFFFSPTTAIPSTLSVDALQAQNTVKTITETKIEKFILKTNPSVTPEYAEDLTDVIVKYAKEFNIEPNVVAGIIKVESRYKQYAVSNADALGYMQPIMQWHEDKIAILIKRFGYFNPFEAEHNIAMGCMILREYLDIHGTLDKALSRYNGSLGDPKFTYANLVRNAMKEI